MTIPSNSLVNRSHLPITSLPDQQLSDRRLGVLSRFNSKIAENGRPPDTVFLEFLNGFMQMGPVDIFRDCFSNSGKKSELLPRLARCHVATSSAGRDFLSGKDMLEQVNGDAWELLRELTPLAREKMLEGASLGERDLIVMTFPNQELRMPLESDCFGSGDGAISEDESRQLMMNRDDTNRTLISNIAREQKQSHAGYYDSGGLRASCAFLERCRGRMPVEPFGPEGTNEALALAFRAVARGAVTKRNYAGVPVIAVMRISAQLFDASNNLKASGLVWRDIAKHYHETGDRTLEIEALNTAGDKLSIAARWFSGMDRPDRARVCLEMAFGVYRKSGNLAKISLTGDALVSSYVARNLQPQARAVAVIIADAERKLGNIVAAERWDALTGHALSLTAPNFNAPDVTPLAPDEATPGTSDTSGVPVDSGASGALQTLQASEVMKRMPGKELPVSSASDDDGSDSSESSDSSQASQKLKTQ